MEDAGKFFVALTIGILAGAIVGVWVFAVIGQLILAWGAGLGAGGVVTALIWRFRDAPTLRAVLSLFTLWP